jgi:hypothetical protein
MINQNSQTSNHSRKAAGNVAPGRRPTPKAIGNANQSDGKISTSETLRRASIACVACRDRRIKVRPRSYVFYFPLTSYSAMEILVNEESDVPIVVQPINLVFIGSMIAGRGNTI